MASQRLPLTRIAGIAAWTAASLTWGTAVVAVANHEATNASTEGLDAPPAPPPAELQSQELASVPTLPESGLLVLRYTPAEKPAPQVIVRRVTASSPSQASPAAPAQTRERSAGS